MKVKVVTVKEKPLDLSDSVLAQGEYREQFLAQPEGKNPAVEVTGCVLMGTGEQLQPLTSDYLCRNYRKNLLADTTTTSYASRISYLLNYLRGQVEFESSDRDEALLSVTIGRLEQYLANLNTAGLAPKTVQGRDAAHHHFFTEYLCKRFDETPALREDNPYEYGLIWSGKANTLGIIQPCSMDELEQLILHADSDRERCLIQAVYDTGMRRSEVPRLTLQAVRDALDFQKLQFITQGNASVTPMKAPYCPLHIAGSKGKKNQINPRTTLVSRTTLERIEDYHKTPLYRRFAKRYPSPEETPAFFNAHGEPYKTKSIEKLFDRVTKRALKAGKVGRLIAPHKLRHGGAYAILKSPDLGKDYLDRLSTLSKSYGHRREMTSEGYTLIPLDLYQLLAEPSPLVKTKASEMELLRERTHKRIRTGDKK
ncbi:site-specific integrase [Pseudomonas sp. HY13-MNA-CIBAN-0226]|uniref:tyrosine-type recombinase/integrase n=1 Tax=Pseudomonas sp. HY13-MNA-CIBAN-0226 TaxID=3140473 RepID=UPI003326F9CD